MYGFLGLHLFVHRKICSLSHRSRVSLHSALLTRVFISKSLRAAHGGWCGVRSPGAVEEEPATHQALPKPFQWKIVSSAKERFCERAVISLCCSCPMTWPA